MLTSDIGALNKELLMLSGNLITSVQLTRKKWGHSLRYMETAERHAL